MGIERRVRTLRNVDVRERGLSCQGAVTIRIGQRDRFPKGRIRPRRCACQEATLPRRRRRESKLPGEPFPEQMRNHGHELGPTRTSAACPAADALATSGASEDGIKTETTVVSGLEAEGAATPVTVASDARTPPISNLRACRRCAVAQRPHRTLPRSAWSVTRSGSRRRCHRPPRLRRGVDPPWWRLRRSPLPAPDHRGSQVRQTEECPPKKRDGCHSSHDVPGVINRDRRQAG